MSGIQDKVIAITGAGSGIGEATARLLAGRGARVMLGAPGIGRLHALAREIAEAGGTVHYQSLDVERPASVQNFIDEAQAVFGRVDVLVDDAGSAAASALGGLHLTVISPEDVARAITGRCASMSAAAVDTG
ncbi:SDR family NAD(P)-dependent oxidoreductase [Variovorax sp. KK3]|uniref:SDR family NAD(P)-dependent oxidoreductase n=1 Tax=Variovorax sp. KK3 TaxID=1855728 RepID=UPI00097CA8F5|nr:SDR family NAD(P)-dependent oxidoreductase [Variovorax sp. KK3]